MKTTEYKITLPALPEPPKGKKFGKITLGSVKKGDYVLLVMRREWFKYEGDDSSVLFINAPLIDLSINDRLDEMGLPHPPEFEGYDLEWIESGDLRETDYLLIDKTDPNNRGWRLCLAGQAGGSAYSQYLALVKNAKYHAAAKALLDAQVEMGRLQDLTI